MEVNQYLEIFLEESKEHLQSLNEKLLVLEKDVNNINLINEIFRSAHTLKGMAATMGYENMATLTHEMENLLDLVRNHKKAVDSKFMDTIFNSVDALEQMVISINEGGTDKVDVTNLILMLQKISNTSSAIKENGEVKTNEEVKNLLLSFDEYERTVIKQSIESGFSIYQVYVKIEEEAVLKSARIYMVFHELEKFGDVLKTSPTIEELQDEDFGNHFYAIFISNDKEKTIHKALLNISEISEVKITGISKEQFSINNEESEIDKEEINDSNEAKEPSLHNNIQTSKAHYGKMIRVDIERLDELMNLFSELVIDRGRLEQLSVEINHPELTDTVEHMSRISSSLQNNILNLRMVPIDQVFNRFPRMIRDLSKDLHKNVRLDIYGADTELDRTVIDEVGDPLVHLLRNAIDHGLELIDERKKMNKDDTGKIILKAYHSGNYVFIEVSDDGKGIDRDKVLKSAIGKGLIRQEEVSDLTEKQVLDLLFTSGLSTAEQVTDISGRGVGLDVVKSKIEALGGFVSVDSEQGKGTKFTIQLPLTLSIISSMLIKVDEEKYAIPLTSIIETAIINKKDILFAHNQEVIDFRGRIVPLVYLKSILEVPKDSDYEEELSVVLVRKGEKMAGLVVDSFIGQQEIVLKTLGSYLTNVFAVSGATILGDGQVALILDTNALIK